MRRFFLMALSLLVAPALSNAALITVEFSGTINQQLGFDPSLIGQTLTGTYTFESTTPALPGTPLYLGAVSEITAEFGGNTFTVSGTGDMTVDNDGAFGDYYFVGLAPGTGTFNGTPTSLGAAIFAIDPTGALLSGSSLDTLPAIPPGTAQSTFQVLSGSSPVVGATITSVRLAGAGAAPIPEPVSTLLLAVGGLLVGSAVRRQLD